MKRWQVGSVEGDRERAIGAERVGVGDAGKHAAGVGAPGVPLALFARPATEQRRATPGHGIKVILLITSIIHTVSKRDIISHYVRTRNSQEQRRHHPETVADEVADQHPATPNRVHSAIFGLRDRDRVRLAPSVGECLAPLVLDADSDEGTDDGD